MATTWLPWPIPLNGVSAWAAPSLATVCRERTLRCRKHVRNVSVGIVGTGLSAQPLRGFNGNMKPLC